MEQKIIDALTDFARGAGRITVLTGAGISAESGIPTFRGPEGYWTVGSKEYHPQEMATHAMFVRHPDEVWKWYLYRMDTCRRAEPNAGHLALVEMEALFDDRFTLVTQNVDGLHLRAGSRPETTCQIHGNVFFMRCAAECRRRLYPLPEGLPGKKKDEDLTENEKAVLRCPDCGGRSRPHVLWFDEVYNEHYFRFESAMSAAVRTDLLMVVGTAGATNLPNRIAHEVARHGGMIIDINIEPNVFSRLAESTGKGFFIQAPSAAVLPEIVAVFLAALKDR